MGLLRILAIATTVEVCAGLALLTLLAAAGAVWPWLDLIDCVSPLFVLLGALAALGTRAVLPAGRGRDLGVGLAALSAVYGLIMMVPEAVGAALVSKPPAAALPFRLVAANVFYENPGPFGAAKSIVARGADAVVVTEADGMIRKARTIFAAAYPYSTHCATAGVQIWLKTPVLAEGCGLFTPPAWHPSWGQGFVWAKVRGPDGKPMAIVGTHLARPYPPTRQIMERSHLPAALAALDPDRVILAGDFNTVPWTFTMRKLDGAASPLRRLTYWLPTYPAQINLTMAAWDLPVLPIDHVYAGGQWSRRAVTRFRVPGSDHFAVEIGLGLRP